MAAIASLKAAVSLRGMLNVANLAGAKKQTNRK